MSLVGFVFVVFITVVTPGPTVLLALSNGSRFGVSDAGFGIAGAALSDIVLICATVLGLGAVLAASAFWFAIVKWAGVIYLAWLGYRMLRSPGNLGAVPSQKRNYLNDSLNIRRHLFQKSFLVAATNPKGYLFFAAFLPQFLDMNEPLAFQYLTLATLFVLIDIIVMTAYAALGAQAVHFLCRQSAIWIDRVCGAVLLALAGTLAHYDRG